MYGSFVKPKMAGIESRAKIKSVNAIATKTMVKEDAIKSYNKMFYAYLRTFTRLELKALPLRASSGPIGGDASHEFIILADTGESQVYLDKSLLDIDVNSFDGSEDSINKMISAFSTPYSATDEKHSEKEFNEKVSITGSFCTALTLDVISAFSKITFLHSKSCFGLDVSSYSKIMYIEAKGL